MSRSSVRYNLIILCMQYSFWLFVVNFVVIFIQICFFTFEHFTAPLLAHKRLFTNQAQLFLKQGSSESLTSESLSLPAYYFQLFVNCHQLFSCQYSYAGPGVAALMALFLKS